MDGSGFGNPERGWNDPPKLAFSRAGNTTAVGPGRHRLLNKRVPIPINPEGNAVPSPLPPSFKASDGPPVKGVIPPHPPVGPPCPPPATTTTTSTTLPGCTAVPSSVDNASDSPPTKDLLEQVHQTLNDSLNTLTEKVKENTLEEIRKRVKVMVEMWQQDQLSEEVHRRMLTLTQALCKHDYDKAWAVHQSLIVDYTTSCSPWMVGIKTLIAEIRSHSEATSQQGEPTDENTEHSEAEQNPKVQNEEKEGSEDDGSTAK